MNTELKIVSIIAAAIVTISAIVHINDTRSMEYVSTMVKNGANPIAARCAIYGTGEKNQLLCNAALNK